MKLAGMSCIIARDNCYFSFSAIQLCDGLQKHNIYGEGTFLVQMKLCSRLSSLVDKERSEEYLITRYLPVKIIMNFYGAV